MKKLKIAIVGAGFSGLASLYHLTGYAEKGLFFDIDIIDPGKIGENASGISAGLLHTYSGAHAKLNYRGKEGLLETLKLTAASEKALGKPIALKTGLLRLALSDEQKQDFYKAAMQQEDIEWLEEKSCGKIYPFLSKSPGIFIKEAYTIRTKSYLLGLWEACKKFGVQWKKKRISSLEELKSYDAAIIAAGALTTSIKELSKIRIHPIKGQILKLQWPKNLCPIPLPINSKAYLVASEDPKVFFAGATFERNFKDSAPDKNLAASELFPKIEKIIPDLQKAPILNCFAALRASSANHLPFVSREGEKIWVIAGMGSKGLLYHALYSKELVDDLVASFYLL